MEKRRVQLVGKSTLTVSLPTFWAKKTGIKRGDFVTIIAERDGSLRIIHKTESPNTEGETIIINADQFQERGLISRLIMSGYVRGYNRIVITSSKRFSAESLKAIRDAEMKLLGLSVVEETPNSIALQCSIDSSSHPIETWIRRLYLLFSSIYDEAVQALYKPVTDLAEEVRGRRYQADRAYSLILRLLNQAQKDPSTSQKIGVRDSTNILNITIIANALERMVYWANKMAESITLLNSKEIELSDTIRAEMADYCSRVKEIHERAVKSLFARSIEQANAAINHFEDGLSEEPNKAFDRLPAGNTFHGFRELDKIIWALHRICENAVTIASTVINIVSTEKNRPETGKIPALEYSF